MTGMSVSNPPPYGHLPCQGGEILSVDPGVSAKLKPIPESVLKKFFTIGELFAVVLTSSAPQFCGGAPRRGAISTQPRNSAGQLHQGSYSLGSQSLGPHSLSINLFSREWCYSLDHPEHDQDGQHLPGEEKDF